MTKDAQRMVVAFGQELEVSKCWWKHAQSRPASMARSTVSV